MVTADMIRRLARDKICGDFSAPDDFWCVWSFLAQALRSESSN
jgi:hypothetical protein